MKIATFRKLAPLPPIASALVRSLIVLTPILAYLSTCPAVLVACGVSLIVIILLLWRVSEPPILLLPVLFQWSEVATAPISTIWKQIPLNELSQYGSNMEFSGLYGLAGVTCLGFGMRTGMFTKATQSFSEKMYIEARSLNVDRVTKVGVGLVIAGHLIEYLSGSAGGLRELFNNAEGIKNIGIFLIAYWCLVRERNYGLMAAVCGFEILSGMLGFFAEFKPALLTIFVAVLAARPLLLSSHLLTAAVMVTLVLFIGSFWSAIKPEYRMIQSRGTGAQATSISMTERLDFLFGKLSSLDGDLLSDGFDRLVARHSYIEFLGLVMQYVPEVMPHEDGKLTLDVITHIAVPRILYPDKPALPSDTDVMKKYTGLTYNWDESVSISIGNLGEMYIDFGYMGGLAAEFVIGALLAFVYRKLRDNATTSSIINAGLCVMIVLPSAYFGTAYVKLVGASVLASVLALVLQRNFFSTGRVLLPKHRAAQIRI